MKKTFFKRIAFFAILSFYFVYVNAQTLEQQLLNELKVTSHPGTINSNNWTKIAECEVTAAWGDYGGIIEFMGTGSGTSQFYYGTIIARFKNQSDLIAPPNFCSLILMDSNFGAENVKGVKKSGTNKVELYIKIPINHTQVHFRQTLKAVSAPLTTFSLQPFLTQTQLNAVGTKIDCVDGDRIQGTESNNTFYSTSPVAGANIVYNATFDDATKLRNIIALRNLQNGSTSNALRQSGIHFSVAGESSDTDSKKSAQILLESSNTYANTPSLNFYTSNAKRVSILNNGRVGIGTADPTEILHVAGNIRATGTIRANEVRVTALGADFVFEPDYDLRSLQEVEQFIKANKHLPEIPSAKEMEEEGIGLSEMNKLLLQKIEELTLYLIEQKKNIDVLKKENKVINEMIELIQKSK